MAKKEEASKIILERTYNIPLRRETLKAPSYRKAKKAITAIREFIGRHMKSGNVAVGKYLNLKVTASKDDKGKVFVELADAPKEAKADEKKKPEPKTEKPEEKIEGAKEEKAEEAKKIEKEEIRELQKEHPKHHAPRMPAMPKQQEAHPTAPKSV